MLELRRAQALLDRSLRTLERVVGEAGGNETNTTRSTPAASAAATTASCPAPSTRAMQSGRGSTGNADAVETTTSAPAKTRRECLGLLDVALEAAHAVRLQTSARGGIRRAANERANPLAPRAESVADLLAELARGAHDDDVTGLASRAYSRIGAVRHAA